MLPSVKDDPRSLIVVGIIPSNLLFLKDLEIKVNLIIIDKI